MNRFFDKIILPLFDKINAKTIVEVGCFDGVNTLKILDYCEKNDANLKSIDPTPSSKFPIEFFENNYGDKFEFYNELSLERIPLLKNYDVILLDGDHNWYTVYNELKAIERNFNQYNFPIILLHDVAWPYGRRDSYYNPDNIPSEFINPYKKAPILPGNEELSEYGMNGGVCNAIHENTPKNGVLTAIEDFLNDSKFNLNYFSLNIFHGLGIISAGNKCDGQYIINLIYESNLDEIVEYLFYRTNLIKDHEIAILKNQIDDLKSLMGESDYLPNSVGEEVSEMVKKQDVLHEDIKLILKKLEEFEI